MGLNGLDRWRAHPFDVIGREGNVAQNWSLRSLPVYRKRDLNPGAAFLGPTDLFGLVLEKANDLDYRDEKGRTALLDALGF